MKRKILLYTEFNANKEDREYMKFIEFLNPMEL